MKKLVLSELYNLSAVEKAKRIKEFCELPPEPRSDEWRDKIKADLQRFEDRNNMTTQEMLLKLKNDEIKISTEIDEWLFQYHLYERCK